MSDRENEYPTKARLMRIVQLLVERPFAYTRKQFAQKYNVHKDTIRNDFNAMQNAGFIIERDEKHRYGFVEEKVYKKLRNLLHFSEEDQHALYRVIDQLDMNNERARQLKEKLGSLYDYNKLGHVYSSFNRTRMELNSHQREHKCFIKQKPFPYSTLNV